MGILDSKSRIIDAIYTVEGRRQLAEGTFNVAYATFSDSGLVYENDSLEGHSDPTDRIYFEAMSLPQDQVVFEANDAGNLVPLRDKFIEIDQIDSLLPKPFVASFVDGKALATQINFGPRIGFTGIDNKFSYDTTSDLGFLITDSSDYKTFIKLVQSNDNTIVYENESPKTVNALVNIKGGISSVDLATKIQEALTIASVTDVNFGAKIEAVDRDKFVYITDINGQHDKIVISGSYGNLSVNDYIPFFFEEALLGGRTDTVDLPYADFASQIEGILTSSFDNFQEQQLLATIDPIFQEDKFVLSTNEITFDVSGIQSDIKTTIPSLNSIDSLFSDDKLSNLDNFRYLPPIVKVSDSVVPDKTKIENLQPYLLGNYPPIGDNRQPLTFNQIQTMANEFLGQKIVLQETTRKNNLLCQIFEVADGAVKKLDIVDFGDVKNDSLDPNVVSNRVFFVGKTFLDDRGTTCYVNMFTLMFGRREDEEEE